MHNDLFDDPNVANAFFNGRQASGRMQIPNGRQVRGRGGTLTSLISEGGATGGAIAGAALGSVVPVLGTAIGGIIGAGIGGFGGRIAENKIRDDRLGLGDAAKLLPEPQFFIERECLSDRVPTVASQVALKDVITIDQLVREVSQ